MNNQIKQTVFILFLLTGLFSLQSCKKDGCMDPTAVNYDPDATESGDCTFPKLSIGLSQQVGDKAFQFGTTYQIGGVDVQFSVAQFYVSGFEVGQTGEFDQVDSYHLIKADETSYEIGDITTGNKQMLRFAVGLDSIANHSDPATYEAGHPLAPKSPSMHWNWNAGYQFIKIEGTVDTDNDGTLDGTIEFHIGTDALKQTVMLAANAEANTEDVRIDLTVDWAKFFEGIDLTVDNITHTGDGPDLAKRLANNASQVFSIQ